MSAFIVSPACMTRVINGLIVEHYGEVKFNDTIYYITPTDLSRLGRTLYAMNRRAVFTRYGTDALSEMDPGDLHETYDYTQPPPPSYAMHFNPLTSKHTAEFYACLKAMHCLLYQCSEGNVPDEPLFAALEAGAGELAQFLARKTQAYENAPWG